MEPIPDLRANSDSLDTARARQESTRLHLHMPVDVRSLSLALLALIASVFALRQASVVIIPLLLGLMVSYALSPLVDRMQRWRVPRAIGAALLLTGIVGGLGWTALSLSDDAAALVEALPSATQKVREALRSQRGRSVSAIDKVQQAASELEQAAQENEAAPVTPRGVTRVRIERPHFDIKDYLWTGTVGVAASVGQAVGVVFMAFFLMVSGSSFRRKMVKIAGPTFAQKRVTVEVLDEITQQIHRYLLVQLFTSALVGIGIGLAFKAVGLDRAAVWGVAAGVLNFVPYLGTLVLTAGSGLFAFVQFGTLDGALLAAGIATGIHVVSGNLLTPWLTSRTSRMNAVAVFVGVLAFGWLWGLWGLLLGVPVLAAVKAVCDRVDDFKAVSELLGD